MDRLARKIRLQHLTIDEINIIDLYLEDSYETALRAVKRYRELGNKELPPSVVRNKQYWRWICSGFRWSRGQLRKKRNAIRLQPATSTVNSGGTL